MKSYNKKLTDVTEKQWPAPGEVFVAMDHKEKLGKGTWIVGIAGDMFEPTAKDITILGHFHEMHWALRFADYAQHYTKANSRE